MFLARPAVSSTCPGRSSPIPALVEEVGPVPGVRRGRRGEGAPLHRRPLGWHDHHCRVRTRRGRPTAVHLLQRRHPGFFEAARHARFAPAPISPGTTGARPANSLSSTRRSSISTSTGRRSDGMIARGTRSDARHRDHRHVRQRPVPRGARRGAAPDVHLDGRQADGSSEPAHGLRPRRRRPAPDHGGAAAAVAAHRSQPRRSPTCGRSTINWTAR